MKKIAVDKLKQHKLNKKIHGDEEISQDFLDSIDTFGILTPLKVKPDNTIISGHRRWKVAKRLNLEEVPTEIITFSSKLEEKKAILAYNNKQRKITFSEKMETGKELEDIEREKAKKRQKELANSHGKDPDRNFPKRGQSRSKVAQKIGIGSGETYRKAKKIWTEKKEGSQKVEELVKKLDEGKETIYGAYKKIKNKENYNIESGSIYLLKGNSCNKYYKIGKAQDPISRTDTLTVKLPFEVELIHTVKSDQHSKLESFLHRKFSDKRVNGEWFDLNQDDVEYIKNLNGDEYNE